MLTFLLAAALLTLLAAAFLAWPLLRRSTVEVTAAQAANVAVYRDQKAEIEAEFAKGAITEAEHAAGLKELTDRLAEDLDAAATAGNAEVAFTEPFRRPWLALGLVLALPLLGTALYVKFGNPAALLAEQSRQEVPSPEEMAELVDRLAARMEQDRENLNGWLLLARSQGALGRHREAAAAYAQADRLAPNDPDILAHWANAEAMAAGGQLAGKPYELALRALAIDPQFAPALALAAGYELAAGALPAARGKLAALLAQIPDESPEKARIAALIAEIDAGHPPAAKKP